jgi:hypothetical protein
MPEIDIVPTNPFWDKPLKTNIPNVPTITGPNTKPIFPFDPFGPVTFCKTDDEINNYNCVTSSVTNIPQFVSEHCYNTTKENKIEDKKQYKTPSELTVITHCLDCDCFENCEEVNLCSHHEILAEIDGNALVKCAENNLKMIKKEVNNEDNDSCYCQNCSFYDDYDMCLNADNFGSITKERISNCNKNKLKRKSNK